MAHQFFFAAYILDNLPAPRVGFDVVQDISEPRLRLYVTSHGVKTFFVRRRISGHDKRIIIGNYPDIDIDAARAAAAEILKAPAHRKIKTHRNKIEFSRLINAYMMKKVRRGELAREKLRRSIDRHLSELFNKNVQDLTAADLSATLGKISGAAMAARMHELVQSIFRFAIDQGYITTSPMANVPKAIQHRRTRPLTAAGLRRLMDVIDGMDPGSIRGAFQMLVYGFAPRSKIFSMQWRDLDFNHYMWGNMPLSDRAAVLLRDMPQDGRWVFPGRSGAALTDPRMTWRRVVRDAGIPNLTMDDVHKFLMRRLTWAADREEIRTNMNAVLDSVLT